VLDELVVVVLVVELELAASAIAAPPSASAVRAATPISPFLT
jgi:hypothetical protein